MDLATEIRRFLLALQFLTRLPVSVDLVEPEDMAASPRWYPAVGAVVGAITGLVWLGACQIWPPLVAAILSLAVGVLVTGGLHEDGLADTCDGLGGGRTKERALEIMRDSRIGSYGALGLGLMLMGKAVVLASLPAGTGFWVVLAGHVGARASMLWVMQVLPYARETGAAQGVAKPLDDSGRLVAAVSVAVALLPLLVALPFGRLILALAGLALGHLALRRRLAARLGGYTGDGLGAVQQASEAGFLLGAAAFAT